MTPSPERVRVLRLDTTIDTQPDEVVVYATREETGRHLLVAVEPVEFPADCFHLIASRWECVRIALLLVKAAVRPPARPLYEPFPEPSGEIPF